MAATIVGALQPEMQNLIKESRILLVGAGGIGCEVLKNLVLTGFSDLEVVDLDTIDVSNLNRQFLFSKNSVGKAKSHVARESVLKFNPNVNIKSHLADIMDQKFGTAFYAKFKLVINALDNRKARSHVNRMCLAADVPLIESGTLGYHGQVEFIKKGLTLCYECTPKVEPKSYPMCTIRNTPKEPIHCVIWAKYLFGQLFGDNEEEVSMEESNIKGKISARQWAKMNDYNPLTLFNKIFIDDIKYLIMMEKLFEGKNLKPEVLHYSITDNIELSIYKNELETKILDLKQYIAMFLDSVTSIKPKFIKSNELLIWDKDDDDFMNFVVAATNIRAKLYNISFKSHFDIKSMAGNIIPAVATANAIVGGQIVMHALRALRGQYERCQSVYLRELPNHKGGFLVRDKRIEKPNPKCTVCVSDGVLVLATDIDTFTIRQLEDLVLKKKLNMVAPDVMVDCKLIISSDEDDEVNCYSQTFVQCGIRDGSRLAAEDYFQNYSVKIDVIHKPKINEESPEFEVIGNLEDWKKADETKADEETKKDENDSDIEMCLPSECMIQGNSVSSNKIVTDDDNVIVMATSNQEEAVNQNEMQTTEQEVINTEISNEEMLAGKRKAETDDNVSESKKSRVNN